MARDPDVLRVPVQLIEAGFSLLLFIALAAAVRRLSDERKWLVLPVYLTAYATARFGLEFLRGDALRGEWLLSTSQWISLALLAALAVFFAHRAVRRRNLAGDRV